MGKQNISLGVCFLRRAIFFMIAGISICLTSGKFVGIHSADVVPGTLNPENLTAFSARQVDNGGGSVIAMMIMSAALEEHNKRRRRHGCPDLVWSNSLQKQAQDYADFVGTTNIFEHNNERGFVGENLAGNGGPDKVSAVRLALVQWYDDEEPKYNYNNPRFSVETGHFTQVVWRDSKELGVGVAWEPITRSWVIVANYNPPGNFDNEFRENVPRPK